MKTTGFDKIVLKTTGFPVNPVKKLQDSDAMLHRSRGPNGRCIYTITMAHKLRFPVSAARARHLKKIRLTVLGYSNGWSAKMLVDEYFSI